MFNITYNKSMLLHRSLFFVKKTKAGLSPFTYNVAIFKKAKL